MMNNDNDNLKTTDKCIICKDIHIGDEICITNERYTTDIKLYCQVCTKIHLEPNNCKYCNECNQYVYGDYEHCDICGNCGPENRPH